MQKFDWVANEMKCVLAQADVKLLGLTMNEENIKAAYIKRGGLVYDTSVETVVSEPEVVKAPVVRRRVSRK